MKQHHASPSIIIVKFDLLLFCRSKPIGLNSGGGTDLKVGGPESRDSRQGKNGRWIWVQSTSKYTAFKLRFPFFHSLDWGYNGSNYFETFTVVYSLNLNYCFYIFWSKGGGGAMVILPPPPLQKVEGHWPPPVAPPLGLNVFFNMKTVGL